MRTIKTSDISKGAMLTVLSVIALYSSTFLVTTKLSILAICSIMVAVAVIETRVSVGLMVYVSASILGFVLVPNKLFIISYICFFGHYPIVKYIIERSGKFAVEWILKLIVFNISAIAIYSIARLFLSDNLELPLSIWIIGLILQFGFTVYDYALSLGIGYYVKNIRPKLDIK